MANGKIAKLGLQNYLDAAISLHRQGFACSQAILGAYAPSFGFDTELALKISTPFAGGIARLGEICGVITGALMVVGLKYGKTKSGDNEAKELTYYYSEEFIEAFKARKKHILCRDLIDIDLNTPEGLKRFREENLSQLICEKFVRDGVEILDQII